ncbi:MAG: GYD domain-containing protein [Betaproteobacteria bacterium]|nr:GYD domain-containing protein [Betaproteobacteria bacterium]MDE2209312.1 GYD domain-containing protein [Betaproteobacteria bacterium]MDE2358993.1 GYD domain-containing protein [Betaproteobacteria bacterium]
MAKYLIKANYTAEGAKGFAHDGGTARRAAVEKMLASVGGRLDAFYFAFGDTDLYVIADLPDHSAAAAVALTVAQSGKASTNTIVLLTPEEMDAASKRTVAYRPPGG